MATIEEFLVSIGYETRQSDVSAWADTLNKFEGWIGRLGEVLDRFERKAAALFVETTVGLDQLNFAAQRTGASVDSLKALTYSLQQMGLGSGRAQGLVEGFAAQMRKLPNLATIQQQFGVKTTQAGAPRDSAALLKDTIRGLDQLEYPVAAKYAELFGIPEADYNVLRGNAGKIDQLDREQQEVFRWFGVDAKQAGRSSTLLSIGWRQALLSLDALLSRGALSLGPGLAPILSSLTGWLSSHQDKIVAACERLLEVLSDLVRDLQRWFVALGPAGDRLLAFLEWAVGADGFVRAVEIVGGAFLLGIAAQFLTPLGLVVTGLVALAAMLSGNKAHAATADRKSEKRGGVFARVKAAMTRKRTHGASGSWGEGGATGSWGGRSRSRAMGGAGATGSSGGGKWEGPVPAPASEPDSALADDRRKFAEEMKDPAVAARFAAYVEAEVGSQGPKAQQAFIESIMNRASSRGQTLRQTLDGSYFPYVTHSRARAFAQNPRVAEKYGPMFDAAMGGSNISGFATGNGSLGVKFGGGPQTSSYGGEDYGIEKADIGWARRMQELSKARRTPPPAMPPKMDMPGFDPNSMFDAPPLGSRGDDLSVSIDQNTEIVVHGDPDPTRTTSEVSAAQVRVNKGMTDQLQKAVN